MSPDISLDWLHARVRQDGDCLIWTGYITPIGQPQTRINKKCYLVQRLIWEAKNEAELPSTKWCSVKCGKPGCVHPDHIVARPRSIALRGGERATTHKAKIAHARRKKSRLSDADVQEIRLSADDNKTLAARFGIDHTYVWAIRANKARRNYSSPFAGLGA